jgi:hypothetical protein
VPNGPTIETLVSEFIPELLSVKRFERVANLVRTATAACAPETQARARDFLRYATYLAAWAS